MLVPKLNCLIESAINDGRELKTKAIKQQFDRMCETVISKNCTI
jgi:hypothetical protein